MRTSSDIRVRYVLDRQLDDELTRGAKHSAHFAVQTLALAGRPGLRRLARAAMIGGATQTLASRRGLGFVEVGTSRAGLLRSSPFGTMWWAMPTLQLLKQIVLRPLLDFAAGLPEAAVQGGAEGAQVFGARVE